MPTPPSTRSPVVGRDVLGDPPFAVVRYIADFRDLLNARRFAAMLLSGISNVFMMSNMVGRVPQLWVLGIIFKEIIFLCGLLCDAD